jgi:hypothetical protein
VTVPLAVKFGSPKTIQGDRDRSENCFPRNSRKIAGKSEMIRESSDKVDEIDEMGGLLGDSWIFGGNTEGVQNGMDRPTAGGIAAICIFSIIF